MHICSSTAISSHFDLFRRQAYSSHLLSLQMQQPSPTYLSISDLYLPMTVFCQISLLKGLDFVKTPTATGIVNFFAFAFPACVLGRGGVGRTVLPRTPVFETELS